MYTVGVLAFKCMKGLAPSYLSDRFVTINRPQVSELFYIEQLNSGTHCHVRSLLQTACVLSKRNLENSFSNHFLLASFYLLL